MFHAGRIEQYLIFFNIATDHGNLCHTAGRQQARTDRPVGNRTQIHLGGGGFRRGSSRTARTDGGISIILSRQADDHHFTQDRRLRAQRRFTYILRKALTHYGQFLGYDLTGPIDIRSPIEFHPYDRKTGSGRRTYTAYVHSTIHRRLHRKSNQAFHLLRCHTISFRHDNYGRSIQIRKHIYIRVKGRIGSRYHQ